MSGEKKSALNFETVASVVAMGVGVCALFVAWDQAQVMRAQKHASVWPIVSADFIISGDEKTRFLEFVVENAGVGPALVESMTLMTDGVEATRWRQLEEELFGAELPGAMAFNGNDIEGAVLAAGESVTVLKGSWNVGDEIDAAFQTLAGRYLQGDAPSVSLQVCYCSVFDRCWRSEEQARSVPVKNCPAPTKLFGGLFTDDEAGSE